MANPVIGWAKENPVAAGAAAVGLVVVVLMLSGGGSSSEGGATDNGAGVSAYYAAVANQAQAGAAIQTAEIAANASTNQALIAASYGLETAKVQADVAKTQIASTERLGANYFVNQNLAIQSQERLGANTNSANVQIAQAQAKAAKYAKGTPFAQGVTAVGGAVSSIGKVLGSIL